MNAGGTDLRLLGGLFPDARAEPGLLQGEIFPKRDSRVETLKREGAPPASPFSPERRRVGDEGWFYQ
jgi:hypothetical protein